MPGAFNLNCSEFPNSCFRLQFAVFKNITYADGKASAALTDAKTYADGKAATAETNAKTYADGLAANYDAKGDAAAAETNAKAYADGLNTTMGGRVTAVETALEVGTF